MNQSLAGTKRGRMIYEGKAKRLYEAEGHPEWVIQEFKDSLTAFNALKKGEFENKGRINRDITSLIYRFLSERGIATHRLADLGTNDMLTEKLTMLKLEVVVRNVLAGSTAKKFALEEGTPLSEPLTEFFYKDDALADPFISDEQALMLKTVKAKSELDELRRLALKINTYLLEFFEAAQLRLIDFKIEFGRNAKGETVLADEITPDSCRLWDKATGEKMDKDRFRRDLGNVKESYEQVAERLSKYWTQRVGAKS
jgi:phosphoribosylaminoimidazole-succinocarboxamide synthase